MGLKSFVKRSFYGRLVISYLHCLESAVIPKIKNDEIAVKEFYYSKTGKNLPLENPKTFSEKMNWYKLNGRNELMAKCADKVSVREYISACGYEDNLNEIYGVYDKVRDIPFDSLPDSYVIKAAHGSHMTIIKPANENLNSIQAKLMIGSWLHQNIYWGGREWVYKDIPKRVIVEKFLVDDTGELRDYKFFCFNGCPQYLQYDGGRFNGRHFRNYYNMKFELLDLHDDVPNDVSETLSVSGEALNEMKEMASVLSHPFQFVRVDFYHAQGKIYIGELTFFHNGGIAYFDPEEYDLEFGNKWELVYGN